MGVAVSDGRWPNGDSYSQWLRAVIGLQAMPGRATHALFDSSTQEPTALLADVTAKAFTAPITDRYQSVFAGNRALIAALAARYDTPPDQILCTAGATSALALIYRTYLMPGDHILVETPGFDLFTDFAASAYVDVGLFQRLAGGALDIDALEWAVRPNTKLIVLSNLHNPTGMPLSHDAFRALIAFADRHDVDIVVDEVYREFALPPAETALPLSPRIIVINSLTKLFGLSALRCGWIMADPSRMEALRIAHSRLEFGASKLAHAVAALILETPAPFEAHWRGLLDTARPMIEATFAELAAAGRIEGAVPAHGCICFPRLTGISDTRRFSNWLARRTGVVVAPGEYFGAAGRVRIGFSRSAASLAQALDLFAEGLLAYGADTPIMA